MAVNTAARITSDLKFNINSDWTSGIFTTSPFASSNRTIYDDIPAFVQTGEVQGIPDQPYATTDLREKYKDILSRDLSTSDVYNKETAAALTMMRSLLSLPLSGKLYSYYKAQEIDSINAAKKTADSIRTKGEIELRNLRYQQEQKRGANINRIAGKYGNLSGSNLDVLMFQQKQQLLDQTTVRNSYEMQASNVVRNGYLTSANLALQVGARYTNDNLRFVGAILQGIDKYYALGSKEQIADINRYTRKRTYVDNLIARQDAYKQQIGAGYIEPGEDTNALKITSSDTRINSAISSPLSGLLSTTQDFQGSNKALNYIQF